MLDFFLSLLKMTGLILKGIKILVGILALGCFSLQMFHALTKFLSKPTMTSGSKESFARSQKPIMLAICKTGQLDAAVAASLGYASLNDYLTGSTSTASILSWNGMHANVTANDVLASIFPDNTSDIQVSGFETTGLKFLLPFGICSIVTKLPIRFLQNGILKTRIDFKDEGEYMIYILDPASALNYQIPINQMTGDRPRISVKAGKSTKKYYSVQLKATAIMSGDEKSCDNYPNSHGHESFASCVDADNYKRIKPLLGCMMPWISTTDQCQGPIVLSQDHTDLLKWITLLYEHSKPGILLHYTSCLPPCNVVTAHGKFMYIKQGKPSEPSRVEIIFVEDMPVEYIIPAYGFDDLLVEIGSSLGLWLGLSLLGLLHAGMAMASRVQMICMYFMQQN